MAKPVSGETLSHVLDQQGMSKAELARRMRVTPPTVASWLKSEEIPSKRVRRLKQILGPLTVRSDGGEMPVSGRTLHEVMDRQGMSDSELAEAMGVTPPAVAYWQKVDTVPAKRIAGLVEILGRELMEGSGTKPTVRALRNRFQDLESKYHVSVQALADLAELSAPAIHNVFGGKTKSPREQTLRRIEDGLGLLQAKCDEGDEKPSDDRGDGDDSAERGNSLLGKHLRVYDLHSNAVYGIDAGGIYLLYGDHAVTYHGENTPAQFHGAPEYVGQTGNIGKRLRQYDERWWFRGVDWIAVVEEDDKDQRLRIESVLIRLLNPQFNKPPGRRPRSRGH